MLFFISFLVCFYDHCYANCLEHLVFNSYARRKPTGLSSSAGGSESPDESSSPHQISHGDKSHTLVASKHPCGVHQCAGMKYNNSHYCSGLPPQLAALCSFLLKTRRFLIYSFILTSVVPFYLYLVHVYIVSRIAQKRNNIKCIISVVLERLLICPAADKKHPPPTTTTTSSCSQYACGLIVCDTYVTYWDIYLYSPYCESQMKWV